MGEVLVLKKSVYGNTLYYPGGVNAGKFARLLGKKTLSREDLLAIKDLGFRVVIESEVEVL